MPNARVLADGGAISAVPATFSISPQHALNARALTILSRHWVALELLRRQAETEGEAAELLETRDELEELIRGLIAQLGHGAAA